MSFSLIVPAAANKDIYKEQIPPIFRLSERGLANCIEAVLNINSGQFTGIYFTILRQHDEKYGIGSMLRVQLDRVGLKQTRIVKLNETTSSQSETVYQTICQEHISGPVFIKDADSMFSADIFPQNGIVVYPLEKLTQVNPQHKSYVAVDDMQYITNTIEKRVIDHYFNAGGYCFEDAHIFCKYYERYAGQRGLYLSHIVYAMLLDKHIFRPFMGSNYRDLDLI